MSAEDSHEIAGDSATAATRSFRELAHEFHNLLSVILGDLDFLRDGLAELDEHAAKDTLLECVANLQVAARRAATLAKPLVELARQGAEAEPDAVKPGGATESPAVGPSTPTCDQHIVPAAGEPSSDSSIEEWTQKPTVPANALALVELARLSQPPDAKEGGRRRAPSRGGAAADGTAPVIEEEPGTGPRRRVESEGAEAQPAAASGEAKSAADRPGVERKTPSRGGAAVGSTILVVEDVESERRCVTRFLEQLGYVVVAVTDGREAVRVFREEQHGIALVLLDLVIPGLSGRETFRSLRKTDPKVKVLLVSGYVDEQRADELLAEGAAGFLQKPLTLDVLSQAVATAIGGVRPVQKGEPA